MRTTDYPKSVPIHGRVRVCLEMVRAQGIKAKKVVDVGSTFGWLEKTLENDGAKEIIGVELSAPAVAFAKKLAPKATFFEGSALDLPIKDGVADIAFLFDVIEHVPVNTEPKALQELHRVLRKGGTLLLSTPHSHPIANVIDIAWYLGHRHYSPEHITQLLKDAGFKVKKIRSAGKYLEFIIFTLVLYC